MIKQERFVDEVTGELVRERVKKISPNYDPDRGYLWWNRKKNARTFLDISLPAELSMQDRGRLFTLSKHLRGSSNLLARRTSTGFRPMTLQDIGQAIGVAHRQARRWAGRMTDLGVMAKVSSEYEGQTDIQYYISPLFFFSSNRLPLNLYLLFRKQLDKHLPKWVIRKFEEDAARDKKEGSDESGHDLHYR